MKKNTAIEAKPSEVDTFISQAIAQNLPVETMTQLFELRAKVKAEKAKEEFVTALSKFQSEVPIIKKTKKVMNKDGRTVRYTFAPIDSIAEQIKKPLVANELSYRWEAAQQGNVIKATCIVTHVLGHSESSSFEVGVDSEGFMTAPQKSASALTFAKRYSLCNALGLSTGDEDDDATTAGKEKDAKSQKSRIINRLRALDENTVTKEEIEDAVKRLAKLDLIEANYDEIVTRLEVIISDRHDAV